MDIDAVCLKILKHRDHHARFNTVIQEKVFEGTLIRKLSKHFGEWFQEHPNKDQIDLDSFHSWALLGGKITEEDSAFLWDEIVEKTEGELDDEILNGFARRLSKEVARIKTNKVLTEFMAGKIDNLEDALEEITKELRERLKSDGSYDLDEVDFDALLDKLEEDGGITWRLECINKCCRPLRPGDFVGVASGVDKGKTSFIASQITWMARQIGEGEKILWFNNESTPEEIRIRILQAALMATSEELLDKRSKGTLAQEYLDALGGNKIHVVDVAGKSTEFVEQMVEKHKPRVVVMDMIDNLTFTGGISHGGERTDQVLEAMYQWARQVLAIIHETIVIATSQMSVDAYGMQFPPKEKLKDSKVGKQGAMDILVMIGFDEDDGPARYIGTPKNKRKRTGAPSSPRKKVEFDMDRAAFLENFVEQSVIQTAQGNGTLKRPSFGLRTAPEKDDTFRGEPGEQAKEIGW